MGGWKAFVLGGAATVAVLVVGAGVVVGGGLFDARASTPHDPITGWTTHAAMIRFEARAASRLSAPAFTPAQVRAGLRDYDASCSTCHGAPGVARAAWVEGMNPPPPYLLDAARHWRTAELYEIVDQGIKMTGMPAWGYRRTDAQVWDLVAFLEALPTMSPADYQRLRRSPPPSPPPSTPTPPPGP